MGVSTKAATLNFVNGLPAPATLRVSTSPASGRGEEKKAHFCSAMDPACNALSISTLSTVSILSGVTGPTIL